MTILHAHHRDYETWLTVKDRPVTEEFVVFLDEGLDVHPDYALLGMPAPVEATAYELAMLDVLTAVSKEYHCGIIIAAHPKVTRRKDWTNHVVIEGHTCDLVRRSKLVLAHDSTAIHFAILWNKPVRLINLDMMKWHEPTQAAIEWWKKNLGLA